MGRGGGVGSEGWQSKVRVEPAAPAAKVAPLPPPPPPQPPPERRRMLLHLRDIVPNSVSSRLNSLSLSTVEPTQRSCSPPLGSLLPDPPSTPRVRPRSPGARGNGTADARGGHCRRTRSQNCRGMRRQGGARYVGSKNLNTVQQFVYTRQCAGAARRRRGWRLACSKRNFRILPADAERRVI
jgi:hypothetical protein